jgi:uncharacterized membrane protein
MSERFLAFDFFFMAHQIMNPMSTNQSMINEHANFKTWKQLTSCVFAKAPLLHPYLKSFFQFLQALNMYLPLSTIFLSIQYFTSLLHSGCSMPTRQALWAFSCIGVSIEISPLSKIYEQNLQSL